MHLPTICHVKTFFFSLGVGPRLIQSEYCADLYAWYLSCIQVKCTENFNSQIFILEMESDWTPVLCVLSKSLSDEPKWLCLWCAFPLYTQQNLLASFCLGCSSAMTRDKIPFLLYLSFCCAVPVGAWVAWLTRCNVTSGCYRGKETLQNILMPAFFSFRFVAKPQASTS